MPVQCEDGATGGDASIQRGRFYAAAPWHGVQATPQAQQKVVPVSSAVLGGARLGGPVLAGDFGGGTAAWGERSGLGTGGDASIQRGGSMPPHRGAVFKQTPQAQQKVVPGSGASIGGVVEMARKKIPAAKTYALGLGQPPPGGWTVKVRFSFKTAPDPANPPG